MDHPNKSRILRPFRLTEGEKRDLIEFLKSLTDEEMLHDPRWSDPWVSLPCRIPGSDESVKILSAANVR